MEIDKFVSASARLAGLSVLIAFLSACGGGGGDGGSDTGGDDDDDLIIVEKDVVPEPRGLLPSLAPSDPSVEGTHHAGSQVCTDCHSDPSMEVLSDVPGETRNVSLGTAWETSLMANATRDPYWHAVVASELDNFPQLEPVINDKCIVCHAPAAHDTAGKEGLDLRLFDQVSEVDGSVINPGLYSMNKQDELFNHAMDGINCSVCHQMDGTNLGTTESMSGGYEIIGSPTGDIADRPAYGQYTDPEVGYMRQQSGFLAQHGPHISTSESCATCHNLDVHPVDAEGNALEGDQIFAEQAIYTEWQLSDFASGGPQEATCQDCHMPKLEQEVYLAQGAAQKRPDFSEHTFLGPNTFMQAMLRDYSEELGIDPTLDFDESIARNREFLKTSAELTISGSGVSNGNLNFNVKVKNLTGHRLPAGYHSRRVYLHVQVLDSRGEQVFESGRIRDDGSIVGVAEDVNSATWETHHDLITSETQVQVYQAITGNSDGERTHSLLASSFYLKDNRLTPVGMDKEAVRNDSSLPDTFGVFGEALTDNDFNNGEDTVSYRVPVSENEVYTVSAELRYQPISYGHLQKLWTQGDRVDQVDMFRTMYEAADFYDEVIDSTSAVMQ